MRIFINLVYMLYIVQIILTDLDLILGFVEITLMQLKLNLQLVQDFHFPTF